jgi:hypothetical protein
VPISPGRYSLNAALVFDAGADGIANGRGVADFSGDALPDTWQETKDPFKEVDRKNFGLSISLTAAAHEATAKANSIPHEANTSPRSRAAGARLISRPRLLP